MAALITVVSSPVGQIMGSHGRQPKEELFRETEKFLRNQIAEAQAHLAERDNWTVKSFRGSKRAQTFEEMLDE